MTDTVVTIEVSVPVARDDVGDIVGSPATFTVKDVWVGWETSTEETDRRETAITNTILWVPSSAPPIPHTATITAPGVRWRVAGKEGSSTHPMTGFNFGRRPVTVVEVS